MGSLNGYAQTPIYPNPTPCGDLGTIRDFTCPDDGAFFQPNRFVIRVQQAPGTRLGTDVYLREVRLIISHPWLADINIRLASPSGKTILLAADKGGEQDNFGEPGAGCGTVTRFSAGSCTPIPEDAAPYTDQPYLPEQSLLSFNDGVTSPLGDWTLLVCDDTEQDSGRLEFVELVFEPMACLPVTNVHLISQDSNTVVLDWSNPGACADSLTILEYGPVGFVPGTTAQPGAQGTVVRTGCPPFLLSGLLPDTDYEVYFRRLCAGFSASENSCVQGFRTGCLPPGPHTIEHFSADTVCEPVCTAGCTLSGIWRNDESAGLPWLVYAGSTPTDGTGPSDAADTGGKYLYIETSGTACNGTAVLQSGCFEVTQPLADGCHFSFSYHMAGAHIGSLWLDVSTDGITWRRLWEKTGHQGNAWQKQYLSLSGYAPGTVLRFRFSATRGGGSLGDIGLDEIGIHGLGYAGWPAYRYYADRDSDGYGNSEEMIHSCDAVQIPGYVLQSGDCNDQNPLIHPGAAEIPCDGIDNNCNGMADDFILPPPSVQSDSVCSGEQPVLRASTIPGGFIFWYNQAGGAPIAFSAGTYSPPLPANQGNTAQTYKYYAQAVDPGFQCFSDAVSEVSVVVLPVPEGVLSQPAIFCAGDSVHLNLLDIRDAHQTGARIRFFKSLPATSENEWTKSVILPQRSTWLAYRLTSPDGCIFEDQVYLEEKPRPLIQLLPADSFSLCIGSTRRVEVARAATGAYRYLWGDGAESAFTQVSGGTVAGVLSALPVQVASEFGCISRDTLRYFSTSSIDSISRDIVDVSSCNQLDGRIAVRPLDGVPPFTYSWESGRGEKGVAEGVTVLPFVLDSLAQGSYRVTITDSSNEKCAFIMPSAYVNGPGAVINGLDITHNACADEAQGRICVRTRSPSPVFSWSTGQRGACIDSLRAGDYDLTITEADCATELKGITITEPAPLKVIPTIGIPTCIGRNDGSIRLQVFGGAEGYRYQWSNGRLTKDIQGLSAGVYTLTLTDAMGCRSVTSFDIPAPVPVAIIQDVLGAVRCNGGQDGSIYLSAAGGRPPYSYQWQDGSQSPVRTGLGAGSYAATITDAFGCTAASVFEIEEPLPLQSMMVTRQLPLCKGDSTGALQVSVQGGTTPYTVNWSTGQTGFVAAALPVGHFWAQVEDARGCRSDTLYQVLNPATFLNWNAEVTPVFCPGRTDGGIRLAPKGNPPFVFRWNRGDTTSVIQDLEPGVYPLTIIDAAGCQYDTAFLIAPVRQRFQVVAQRIAPTCSGGSDGAIYIQPRQIEFPPLRYRWENGNTTRDRQSLPEGRYGLTVTDAMGCTTRMDSMLLQSPPPMDYTLISQGTLACKGDSTAFLELAVHGGQPPYAYRWQGTTSETASAYQLKAGFYQVYIQDARGCPIQAGFTVSEPDALTADISVTSGNICVGDTTLRVQATVTGGVGPYQLAWSNGATWAVLENPLPGDYTLTVSDAGGCRRVLPALKIREATKPLKIEHFEAFPITCFGRHDGRLEARVSGGKAPYTYLFKGTSTLVKSESTWWNVSGLGRGASYAVVVTDALGCRVESATRAVYEPPEVQLVLDSVHAGQCADAALGDLFISASGGSPPFVFNWTDASGRAFSTTEDLIGIPGGVYTVIATDIFLCTDTLSGLVIGEKKPLALKRVLVNGITCKGEATGSLLIELEGGKPPYQIWWNGVAGGPVLGNLPAGSYQPEVVDADQCRTLFPPIKVGEPDSVLLVRETVVPVSCGDRSDGAVFVAVSGGKKPYKLIWQNKFGETIGLDSMQLTRLKEGSYGLLVQDSFHCLRSYTYPVGTTPPIAIDWDWHSPGVNTGDGRITARASGGTPPYFFSWNTGEVGPVLDSISSGTYALTVTDTRNCSGQDTIYLVPTGIRAGAAAEAAEVRIFPNPTSGTFFVFVRVPAPGHSLHWVLRNSWGQLVQRGVFPEGNEWLQELMIQQQPDGIYFLSLEEAGRVIWTGRILLQK